MTLKTSLSVAGMVAITAVSFTYMGRVGLETDWNGQAKSAQVQVNDTNGLVVGSRVLLRGIAIGHVSSVTTSADAVDVEWKYDRNRQIPIDSMFRVDNLSALGETYLSVLPSSESGPFMQDGDAVLTSRVVVPTTFKELSERLTRLLEQVDPVQVQEVFDTINVALPDDLAVLDNLNRAGESLASTLRQQLDNVTTLLATLQPLLMDSEGIPKGLEDATPRVAEFGSGFRDLLSGIHFAVVRGPLRDGIANGVSPMLTDLQKFLDEAAPSIQEIGVNLLPAVQAGASSLRTVDIGRLLDNAMMATNFGDALTVRVGTPGG